jgi:hypothetical protein
MQHLVLAELRTSIVPIAICALDLFFVRLRSVKIGEKVDNTANDETLAFLLYDETGIQAF